MCEYCRLFEPALWSPPSPALRELRDLVRTRQALTASRVDWTNRRGSGQFAAAADAAMAAVITQLEEQVAAVERALEQVIAADPDLKAKRDLLVSVPGIGPQTAAIILSELPGPEVLCTARQAAAYAGLNPSHRQSGSSLDSPSRISRIGNATLRAALYFPALAAMRKVLHLCFGVLKTGQPFAPDWRTSSQASP